MAGATRSIYELNTAAWLHDVGVRGRRAGDAGRRARRRVGRGDAGRRRRRLADGGVGAQPGRRARWRSTSPEPGGVVPRRARPTSPTPTSSARPTASAATRSTTRFGGRAGLAAARAALAERGVRLLVDFVPNHVAPDHPWLDRASRVLRPGHRRRPRRATRRRSSQVGDAVDRPRPRPVLPAVARRRPARTRSRPALRARGRGDARRHRRRRPTACAATWRC